MKIKKRKLPNLKFEYTNELGFVNGATEYEDFDRKDFHGKYRISRKPQKENPLWAHLYEELEGNIDD